jgi:hypothetical protein
MESLTYLSKYNKIYKNKLGGNNGRFSSKIQ